jgi:hypothetical protein
VGSELHQIEQGGNPLPQLSIGKAVEATVQFEKFSWREPVIEAEVFGKKSYSPPRLHITGGTAKYLGLATGREYEPQHHFY